MSGGVRAVSEGLVSIIIPTYYRDDTLRRAIRSALAQDYPETEVIVVDDSGEAYARPIVESFDVEYLPHETNRGGNPARNTGYEAASGQYIQFLDDDDLLYESKVSRQVALLEDRPSTGVAYAGIVDRGGTPQYPASTPPEDSLERALQLIWPPAITSSLLIDDSVLRQVAPLEARRAADDVGMKIELAMRTEFDAVPTVLTELGDSPGSRSQSMAFVEELENILDEYAGLYDRYPDRVERTARANVRRARAGALLREHRWSARAILNYLAFVRLAETPGLEGYAALVAALFGSPGLRGARTIRQKLL